MEQDTAWSVESCVDEGGRIADGNSSAFRSGRDGAAAGEIGIGSHAASRHIQNVVHQVASPAIHRQAFERTGIDGRG